jgi:hypothetical protein
MGQTYLSKIQTPPLLVPMTTKTGAATLTVKESGIILVNADNVTIAPPTAVGYKGLSYIIKEIATKSAGITVDPYSSQTIDGSTSLTNGATNDSLWIVSDGTNWVVAGKVGTWS